jgi:hypothetical protein
MKALYAWRGSLGLVAVTGFSTVFSGCGSDFTCVESRTCPSGVAPGGSAGSSGSGGSGAAGSAGAQGAGADSGAGDSGSSGTAGEAGSVGGGGNETDAGPDVEAGPDAPSCETEQPNLERGIFVSSSGSDGADGSTCGAIGAPCATIKKALGFAKANSVIYLDAGTYEEDGLALVAGVTLQGGWERHVGGAWSRACTKGRESATVIRAKSADRTLSAVDLGGLARLEVLTIRSKLVAALAEQSLYGIFAVGATTQLALRDVAIEVGGAGAGKTGAAGADGGRRGRLCGAETGADGAAVGTSGAGAMPGSFSVAGYRAGSGSEGGPGSDGAHGTAAPPAPCVACRDGGATCAAPCTGSMCGIVFCSWSSSYAACGDGGSPGCAGGGGGGGKPGTGGGSSVGIFVWGATVRLDSGRVQAGRGGDGGSGGPGGPGGVGTAGLPGSAPGLSCEVCSGSTMVGCGIASQAAAPGAPGGRGGSGKAGGPGGGGSGGHSYAMYKGGSAIVNIAAGVELSAGIPGSGGGAVPGRGADGAAKPIGP